MQLICHLQFITLYHIHLALPVQELDILTVYSPE